MVQWNGIGEEWNKSKNELGIIVIVSSDSSRDDSRWQVVVADMVNGECLLRL